MKTKQVQISSKLIEDLRNAFGTDAVDVQEPCCHKLQLVQVDSTVSDPDLLLNIQAENNVISAREKSYVFLIKDLLNAVLQSETE